MELSRKGKVSFSRAVAQIAADRFILRPTVNWLVDPIIGMLVPDTTFLMQPGDPPAAARYAGPRNYAKQSILIQRRREHACHHPNAKARTNTRVVLPSYGGPRSSLS